jgi:hypothetical protein
MGEVIAREDAHCTAPPPPNLVRSVGLPPLTTDLTINSRSPNNVDFQLSGRATSLQCPKFIDPVLGLFSRKPRL